MGIWKVKMEDIRGEESEDVIRICEQMLSLARETGRIQRTPSGTFGQYVLFLPIGEILMVKDEVDLTS